VSNRIRKYLLLGAALIFLGLVKVGCEYFPESTFELATESRLPKWITLPPGLTRADVSLTISYYSWPWEPDARFILRDKNGRFIKKESGKTRCNGPFQLTNYSPQGFPAGYYPNYEAVVVNGVTEIIEQKKPEPILWVTDDTAVWNKYESRGC
jgi:hypothetical protein